MKINKNALERTGLMYANYPVYYGVHSIDKWEDSSLQTGNGLILMWGIGRIEEYAREQGGFDKWIDVMCEMARHRVHHNIDKMHDANTWYNNIAIEYLKNKQRWGHRNKNLHVEETG